MRRAAVINVPCLLIAVVHSSSGLSSHPMISPVWLVAVLKMGDAQ